MTYHLSKSEWMNSSIIPEGMHISMLNNTSRLYVLLTSIEKEADGKVVIDMGCGTGVLGLYALKHGAKFVYFVEQDKQMIHILKEILPKQISPDKFKIIDKDVEDLSLQDFDLTPNLVVSELYGPRLFDEGYVKYVTHIKSFLPNCEFIPEQYVVKFCLEPVNYSLRSLWPADEIFKPYFKFMYQTKGFMRRGHVLVPDSTNDFMNIGQIDFDTNTLQFNNSFTYTHKIKSDVLLTGFAIVKHKDVEQVWTEFGWFFSKEEYGQTFHMYFDEENYYNPVKEKIE